MTWEHLLVEVLDGVGVLTLNRPDKLNALNRQLSNELHLGVQMLDRDPDVRCIVITGNGDKAFSAGGDIHEQRHLANSQTPEEAELQDTAQNQARFDIADCSKPTIGMINGLAYGGAAALASSLDIRTGCEEHARFRFLAVTYGRVNSTWSLPNQVIWPVAKELLFTGRVVPAKEAYRLGLLNHIVPCADLREFTMDMARTIASNDPAAVQAVKLLLQRHPGSTLGEQWAAEASHKAESQTAPVDEAFADFFSRKGEEPS